MAILVETAGWTTNELTITKMEDTRLSLIQSTKYKNHSQQHTMLVSESACSWRSIIDEYIG
ncbi:hypothetical protein [Halalkalibacter hemicellulosilyticus]|uniref:Transcriptional regulator n=1 Tax=Halalkalibacter hemicellulosilyticusJCM 9152 TaxID=1236971 RepID=W4QDC9_9BACI|nr:hypothetical protein [Halalkalibacter hemicellulosilyticus]GAE29927.1 transcriptional regulator [Halalkalibacter hemicellulosilyticusJCM 9152]